MDKARINLIVCITIALTCTSLIAIKVQDYATTRKPTITTDNDPIHQWEVLREEREKNLTEARKKGIPHEQIILQKCDCPHSNFNTTSQNETLDILNHWQHARCKKLCEDSGQSVKTSE
ncbi:MAG: hypothetical protein ACRBDI_09845 [Alphaproteobacteria bacterium]